MSLAGLPGTGKSHLAEAVRAVTGAVVVRTDEVRKIIAPVPTYAPAESAAVYATCFATVRALLGDRYAVVLDGTNGRRAGRRRLAAIARIEGAGHASVLVHAAPEVVRARIARRTSGLAPAYGSEAGIDIYVRMAVTEDYGGHFDLVVDAGDDIRPAVDVLSRLVFEARAPGAIGTGGPRHHASGE